MSILTLPRELQLHIIGLLPVREKLRLSETCHGLKELVRDPSLWKKLVLDYDTIKNNTEACRKHVARCSKLKELYINFNSPCNGPGAVRSDKIMSVVMKAKRTLSTLSIDRISLSNSSFKQVSQITQLTKLAIHVGKMKTGGFSDLANLSKLESIRIRGFCSDVALNDLVDFFSILNQLEEVEFNMFYLKDDVIKSLVENNPKLHHLTILGSHFSQLQLTGKSLNLIAENCPQLTHIGIVNHHVFQNADIINLVSKCSKLKHVNFGNTVIKNDALARLARDCPDLEHLNISRCVDITEQGVEAFLETASQAKLKHLDIRDCCGFLFPSKFVKRLKKEYPHIEIVY